PPTGQVTAGTQPFVGAPAQATASFTTVAANGAPAPAGQTVCYANPPQIGFKPPKTMEEVYVAARDTSDQVGNWLTGCQDKKDQLWQSGQHMNAKMQDQEYATVQTTLGQTIECLGQLYEAAGTMGGEHADKVKQFIGFKVQQFNKVFEDFEATKQSDVQASGYRQQIAMANEAQTRYDNAMWVNNSEMRMGMDRQLDQSLDYGGRRGGFGGGCGPMGMGGMGMMGCQPYGMPYGAGMPGYGYGQYSPYQQYPGMQYPGMQYPGMPVPPMPMPTPPPPPSTSYR
ncbi:MAG TPA: hypothetical protein VGO93_15580, partial [Candidatus Xenobia bacterium]